MKSEMEIKEKINRLLTQEKEAVAEMEEAIEEGGVWLSVCINKANGFQYQRLALEWVLNA